MKKLTKQIIRGALMGPLVFSVGYFNVFNFVDTKNPKVASLYFLPQQKAEAAPAPKPTPIKNEAKAESAKTIKLTPKEKFEKYLKNGWIKTDADAIRDVRSGAVKPNTLNATTDAAEFLGNKGMYLKISCFRTGNPYSVHKNGFAFDISNESVAKTLLPWLSENRTVYKIREIIFDSSLVGKTNNYYNLYNGKPHKYSTGTVRQHRNHIHVATY